jgi:hypothetical protein
LPASDGAGDTTTFGVRRTMPRAARERGRRSAVGETVEDISTLMGGGGVLTQLIPVAPNRSQGKQQVPVPPRLACLATHSVAARSVPHAPHACWCPLAVGFRPSLRSRQTLAVPNLAVASSTDPLFSSLLSKGNGRLMMQQQQPPNNHGQQNRRRAAEKQNPPGGCARLQDLLNFVVHRTIIYNYQSKHQPKQEHNAYIKQEPPHARDDPALCMEWGLRFGSRSAERCF